MEPRDLFELLNEKLDKLEEKIDKRLKHLEDKFDSHIANCFMRMSKVDTLETKLLSLVNNHNKVQSWIRPVILSIILASLTFLWGLMTGKVSIVWR